MSKFQDLMPSIKGAEWAPAIRKRLFRDGSRSIGDLCEMIMESDGEYSSLLISDRILSAFEKLDKDGLVQFFTMLNDSYDLDPAEVKSMADEYARNRDVSTLQKLSRVSESRRQELFRRLNLAPGGTTRLVKMREELIKLVSEMPELGKIDADFRHLFSSWFNRGFLAMHPIDWTTPAHILEKIIAYEAVHEIGNWDELRSRLEPGDRDCYAFFHPAMEDEPLVFVEVALMDKPPKGISEILDQEREIVEPEDANCAAFYSISNCHSGLAGVSFGNFLIRQVATSLKQRFPNLKTFTTISPLPGFRKWLGERSTEDSLVSGLIEKAEQDELEKAELNQLSQYAARYFLEQESPNQKPPDPVARFHLKNGARLERINLLGDMSDKGMAQSLGVMVNYVYDLSKVEENHEKYMKNHKVVSSSRVRKLLP
jgi:malonyl-CoA decarboxylase